MTEDLQQHLDDGKQRACGHGAIDQVHGKVQCGRSLRACNDTTHENKTEIAQKREEDDRHDVGEEAEVLAALFGEHFFHEDRHANVRAVLPACSHAQEGHVDAQIADDLIAPVEGEMEAITQDHVHHHDDGHRQNENGRDGCFAFQGRNRLKEGAGGVLAGRYGYVRLPEGRDL